MSNLATKPKSWMVPQSASTGAIPVTTIEVDPTDTGVVTHMMKPTSSATLSPYQIVAITYDGSTVVYAESLVNIPNYGYPSVVSDRLIAGNAVVHSAIYPSQIHAYSGFTGDWTRVDVTLLNSSATQISGLLRFTKRCIRSANKVTRVAFLNSVGGYSYYSMDGRTSRRLTRRQKVVDKVVGTYGAQTFDVPVSAPDTETFGVELDEVYTLNAQVKLDDMFLLEEMFKSRTHSIQLDSGEAFIPVILDTSSISIKDEPNSSISQVSVDVKLAQRVRC